MNSARGLLADQNRSMLLLTAAWTMAGVALFIAAPIAAPFILPLCMVAPLAWLWFTERRLPTLDQSPVTMWLGLAGIYLLINASWSLDRSLAYLAALVFFILIGTLHATRNALRGIGERPLQAMAAGFCAAVLLGSLFLCYEVLSAQSIRRLIMNHALWLRPKPHHLVLEADWIIELPGYLLNRSITAWTLLVWPALLVLSRLDLPESRRTRLIAVVLLPGVPAIYLSDHGTSKLAFLAAAVTYAVFGLAPMLTRRLVFAGWLAATLLVVPVTLVAYSSQLYLSPWLVASAQDRIVLWGYTSQQIWKAPILGVGINTSNAQNRDGDDDAPLAPGSELRLSIRHHTHSAYLQTWYEAGAVGVLFLLGFGLLLLRAIARAPLRAQPYLYATFVTSALVAASSFSVWQPWFMASFGLTAVFAALGTELAARE
jgi:O-antigen ligase